MTETTSFTDIMRPPEIDACKAPMRRAIQVLMAQGSQAHRLPSDLGPVLVELMHEDIFDWTYTFQRICNEALGPRGLYANRFPSGWSGRALKDKSLRQLAWRQAACPSAPIARKYPDKEYERDMDLCSQTMRDVILKLQAKGYRARYLSLALLEVLAETAEACGADKAKAFYRHWADADSRAPEDDFLMAQAAQSDGTWSGAVH